MIDVTMPKWGDTMQTGVIVEWMVEAGEQVVEGDVLATVETEKVQADVEAPAAGTVRELLVEEGDEAAVGAVLARIEPSAE
ncbi:MAG TPA: biotin/lipoyl-containing protein [Conexibacter sp.]|nr:biotin/lipoyl-containing protein [Conexibacter sp.]